MKFRAIAASVVTMTLVLVTTVSGTNICQDGGFDDSSLSHWTQWWASWGGNSSWHDSSQGQPAPCLYHEGGGSQGRYQEITPPGNGDYTVWASWSGDNISWAEIMFFAGSPGDNFASRMDAGNATDIAYKKDAWGMNPPTTWSWEPARLSHSSGGNDGKVYATTSQKLVVGTKLGNGGWLRVDNVEVYGDPTLALISAFGAAESGDGALVSWTTAVEYQSAGFFLERFDPDSGGWLRVSDEIVPAAGGPGAVYEVYDGAAFPGGTFAYRLIELETTGMRRAYGPYRVTVGDEPVSFEEWCDLFFTVHERMNAAFGGVWGDADGDGAPNVCEYRAGTHPLDAASRFRVVGLRCGEAGDFQLRWSSTSGNAYCVEAAPAPGGPWTEVAGPIEGTPPFNCCTGAAPPAARVYRVRVLR